MADRGLGGRLARSARLARTGARGVLGLAGANARRLTGGDQDSQEVHEQLAAHLAEVLGEMKGAAMKVGQLLSFVDLDLPPEIRSTYHDALAKLRDNAPPMSPESIHEVVEAEYGAPARDVFATWEEEPLAAASIGQVHAATLDDGREVVVKVQYPGVAAAVRADLRNAELFAPLARLLAPNQEIDPLLQELRDRVEDELDYRREARYQAAFATRYAGHPFIRIPEVVSDFSGSQVLVMERIHGTRFDEFVATSTDDQRQRVAEIIFRYAFGSVGRFRLFNGDPHPGNYLITPEGDVAFLDYGSVKMFSRDRYRQVRKVDDAVLHGDSQEVLRALREAGFVPAHFTPDADQLRDWFRLYYRPIVAEQPFEFTPDYAAEVLRTATDPLSDEGDMLRRLNLPADYLLLNRIQWGLNSILGRLRGRNHWRAIREEIADGRAPSTPLGELDRAWMDRTHPDHDVLG